MQVAVVLALATEVVEDLEAVWAVVAAADWEAVLEVVVVED